MEFKVNDKVKYTKKTSDISLSLGAEGHISSITGDMPYPIVVILSNGARQSFRKDELTLLERIPFEDMTMDS